MILSRIAGPLLLFVMAPAVALAQVEDARVLPPGMVRLQVGGTSAFFDARFGTPGTGDETEREPLSAEFGAVLVDTTFSPILTLQENLNTFFEATDTLGESFRASPDNLRLMVSDIRAAAEIRTVPVGLELGVLPRISARVRVPFVNNRLGVRRLGLGDGTVGINPDPAFNRTLLAELDTVLGADFAALGESGLLPIQDSEAGRALQEKVRAAGAMEDLRLPAASPGELGIEGFAGAAALGTGRFGPPQPRWEVGDAELAVKLQILNTHPGYPYPREVAGIGYRGAVEAGMRVATGTAANADYLVLPIPEQGLSGMFVQLYNDFLLSRLSVSTAARWERLEALELQRRIWSPATGEFAPNTLVWEPGTRLAVWLSPRFRLAEELAVIGGYRYLRRGGESFTLQGIGASPAVEGETGTAQQWSAGLEFSTLPAFLEGETPVPFAASLLLRETFAGSGGAVATRALEVRGSLYYPLWGGR